MLDAHHKEIKHTTLKERNAIEKIKAKNIFLNNRDNAEAQSNLEMEDNRSILKDDLLSRTDISIFTSLAPDLFE